MDIKKILQVFLGSWAVLIFLTVLTDAAGLRPAEQVICTGVLAALVALLAWVATRGEKNKKNVSLHAPGSAEVLYRVDGMWIYKGWEEKASWYIKRGAVYGFASMTPLYRLKDNKVWKEGESEPFLSVEGNKVISCESGQVMYELK